MSRFKRLKELDHTPIEYRIPDLLTTEGNVLISAYRKTGKTSLILNLIAALTTEADFLGGLSCIPLAGPVVYVNLELHESMLLMYCEQMGLDESNDAVLVDSARGHASQFRIADDDWRESYAADLLKEGASALVIDPISPLMAMHGVDSNDNDMSRMVLEQLGEIAVRAHLNHLFVVDHTGHAERGRSRGASAKEDWADVLWNIGADPDGASPYRSLTVTGRGVSGEARYMRRDKHLYLAGSQNGSEDRAEATLTPSGGTQTTKGKIMSELRRGPRTIQQLLVVVGTSNSNISAQLNELEEQGSVGRVGKTRGKGGAEQWMTVKTY